jgi:hypothetical protein
VPRQVAERVWSAGRAGGARRDFGRGFVGVAEPGMGAVAAPSDLDDTDVHFTYDWLGMVNPGGGGGFATNCLIAVQATDMALRTGEVHIASPTAPLTEQHLAGMQQQQLGLPDTETRIWSVPTVEAVREAMLAAGDGARGVVVVRGVGSELGHAFNVVRHTVGGKPAVTFLDGQRGGIARVPERMDSIQFVPLTPDIDTPAQAEPVHIENLARLVGVTSGPLADESSTTDQMTAHLVAALNDTANLALPKHPILGPDLFGLRQARPRPPLLQGVVQANVSTRELGALFDRLDMTGMPSSGTGQIWWGQPRRREWWSPDVRRDLVSAGVITPLGQVQEMPLAKHTIWLGGPLTRPEFLTNIAATAAVLRPHGFRTVLWTDVPRSAFAAVNETSAGGLQVPPELRDVAAMLVWARSNGVRLVNVDEVFHAEEPMLLNEFYRSELAKQTGRGYAAASDILRLEILRRFGGVYSDPDNHMHSVNGVRELFDEIGLAIQYTRYQPVIGVINSVLLAARNHPFISLYLSVINGRYNFSQDQILGPGIVNASPDSFNHPQMHVRRNSVMGRTGPGALFEAMMHSGYQRPHLLPHFSREVFTVESASSWTSTSPLAATRRTAPGDEVRVLQGVITTTFRDLAYRDGKAHATSYASVINSLPDPAAGWRAWAEFLLAFPSVRKKWKGITVAIRHPGPDLSLTESWVELPAEVYALLGIPDPGGTGFWRAGEYRIPTRLTVPGHTSAG